MVGLFRMMSEKMVPRWTCVNTLWADTFSPFFVLDLKRVFCIWQHNDVGVVIEGSGQQRPKLLVDCRVPLFVFGKSPVNSLLAGGQLPTFCNEDVVHSRPGPVWQAKYPYTITLA